MISAQYIELRKKPGIYTKLGSPARRIAWRDLQAGARLGGSKRRYFYSRDTTAVLILYKKGRLRVAIAYRPRRYAPRMPAGSRRNSWGMGGGPIKTGCARLALVAAM